VSAKTTASRIGMLHYNTSEEVDRTIAALAEIA
jgi:selenocysteine lyase/cysteine desulfurase